MNATHTPGPWTQTRGRHTPKDKDRRCFWVVNAEHEDRDQSGLPTRICDLYAPHGLGGFQTGEANARLIAAAPALYAALEAAQNWLREYHTQHGSPMDDEGLFGLDEQMQAALAAARGE